MVRGPHLDAKAPHSSMIAAATILLVLACWYASPVSAARTGSRGAMITLSAQWPSTATILEAAECVADDSPRQYRHFVDAWLSRDSLFEEGQDHPQDVCWRSILAVAGRHLSPGLAALLPVILASRKYSPRLEVFASLATEYAAKPEACCWVDVHGRHATTLEQLSKLLAAMPAQASPKLFKFDHVHPAATDNIATAAGAPINQTVAILYAAIGTSCFAKFHRRLSQAASSSEIKYVLRPVLFQRPCRSEAAAADRFNSSSTHCPFLGTGGPLQLPGFGVEMAVKNMEYSALDDSKAKQEAVEAEADAVLADSDTEGFLFNRLLERRPEARTELLAFREALLASASSDQKLKVWDLKDLGLQAAQRVLAAADAIAALTDIAQNFPMLASSLSRLEVSKDLRAAVISNGRLLPAGSTYLLLNGVFVDTADVDLYSLLDIVQHEVALADELQATGLPPQDVRALLASRAAAADADSPRDSPSRIDIGPVAPSPGSQPRDHTVWLNDLEHDARYAAWPKSLMELLQPSFMGQMPLVARNLLHTIVIADLGTSVGLTAAAAAAQSVSSGWPIRVGLLPPSLLATAAADAPWAALSVSAQASAALTTVALELGGPAALSFILRLADAAELDVDSDEATQEYNLKSAQVDKQFLVVWQRFAAGGVEINRNDGQAGEPPKMAADVALEHLHAGTNFAEGALQTVITAAKFVQDKGFRGYPNPIMTMNGAAIEMPSTASSSVMLWRQLLVAALQRELRQVQEWLYYEKLKDSKQPLLQQILKLSGAVSRHNPRLLPPANSNAPSSGSIASKQVALTAPVLAAVAGSGQTPYLHQPATLEKVKAATHWVITDISTEGGRHLAAEAMTFLSDNSADASQSRMALIHNPRDATVPLSPLQSVMAAAAALPARRQKLPAFFRALLGNATLAADLASPGAGATAAIDAAIGLAAAQGLNERALQGLLEDTALLSSAAAAASAALREAFDLAGGASAIVTNGRVLYIDAEDEEAKLVAADFALLQSHAASAQFGDAAAAAVIAALDGGRLQALQGTHEDEDLTSEQLSDIVAQASSIMASSRTELDSRSSQLATALEQLQAKHVSVKIPAVEDAASVLQATVLVDPLSKAAQKLAPLLAMLREHTKIHIQLFLNPVPELSDLPLKSYYRYAIPQIHSSGPEHPAATFDSLPGKQVLTLNMDVPEAWLVEAVEAEADLDNLKLSELPVPLDGSPALHAKFQLEALLLTGQCIDSGATTRQQMTPRGVQLWAGRGKEMHFRDTLVMSNLGYFQLQASPGAWTVYLAPGRSQELYHVVPAGNAANNRQISAPALVDSLQGHHILLRVRKNEGKEDEDVLDSSSASSPSSWGQLFSAKPAARSNEDERVHVFTVASGHMYERLQKIMILSVLRNTKSRLKVWFIKNYMSPQMRAFVPHMAAHYGFDFEFVTYKWPTWLHKQTEKQRIIWAYKILFLDVLFPLDLKKVIFLDADQIIRTDIKELADLDLKGAPYGYTPFCDNNREMDGFRFWKHGFWKNHLRGRPYHISALYVIDLVRFRQTAAGDQLRVIYDQLSKDPNSLSNLDQDLPNYAQHQVKIYSLPQEWLWCETWCGNTTEAAAKTIDLCNNPLTKEPKLDNARRIVAEWPALDQEARDFTAQVEQQLQESQLVANLTAAAHADTATASSSSSAASLKFASTKQTTDGTVPQKAASAAGLETAASEPHGLEGLEQLPEGLLGEGQAPEYKALKEQISALRDKIANARNSEGYTELSSAKQALLKQRMDLASECVLKNQQDACTALEALPELEDVSENPDAPSTSSRQVAASEADHQQKVLRAGTARKSEDFSIPGAGSGTSEASSHDEL